MPRVGGKHFAYTKAGYQAAAKARKRRKLTLKKKKAK